VSIALFVKGPGSIQSVISVNIKMWRTWMKTLEEFKDEINFTDQEEIWLQVHPGEHPRAQNG